MSSAYTAYASSIIHKKRKTAKLQVTAAFGRSSVNMGLNTESINKSAKRLNMTSEQVLEMMLKDFYAAEPFDFDDPIMHTADIKLSDEDEKRYNATFSKRWLIDIGYFDTDTAN